MEVPSASSGGGLHRPTSRPLSQLAHDEVVSHLMERLEDPKFDMMREELHASTLMKELTHKYGTRGKSQKYIFLQAFNEGQKANFHGLSARPHVLTCEPELSQEKGFLDDFEDDWDEDDLEIAREEMRQNPVISQAQTRPAAMVNQSNFVSKLEGQVKVEILRAGCTAPLYDLAWLYEQLRHDLPISTGTGTSDGQGQPVQETHSIRDVLDETEEKMVARLKIYRRAFSALILHFEALRPILKDIKRNYDDMLGFRERQVHDVNTVKKNIHHLELHLDERLATVRFEGFKELGELEKQSLLLMRHVDRQDLAIRTMNDILNKLENSLSEEHDLRRDSDDQRKLLIVEINELRRKLGMSSRDSVDLGLMRMELEEEEAEIDEITSEDPILLRRALEITRTNLAYAHHRLEALEADYTDVIPRHEFEELKVLMKTLESEHAQMTDTYNVVHSEVDGLRVIIEKLTGARNNLQDLVGDLRKRATPRPSWEKIAEHIDGGLPKWKALIEGKPTAEIVPTLVQELTGKKLLGPPEFIPAAGTGPQVPAYLRHDTQVRRRTFSRRDALVVIQDIWQLRSERLDARRRFYEAKEEEASGEYGASSLPDVPDELPIIIPFALFFHEYFQTRFHLPNMRMEWIYNILETCRNLRGVEPKLGQFLDTLESRKDEGVYHLFRGQVAKLRNAVIEKSEETGQSTGSIQFGQFGQLLTKAFRDKSPEEIQRLLVAVSKQTGIHAEFSVIKYVPFFAMTDEGLVGNFVEEFAKQFEEDRLRYVYEIMTELLAELGVSLSSAERENDPAGDTDVTMQQVFSALVNVDPTLPDDKLGATIVWVFFGDSILPGALPRGLRLVDFLRQHLRLSEFHEDEEPPEDDQDDFERAIGDVLTEQDQEEVNELSEKAKKKWLQKKRVMNLATVVKRLKGGAFLRHGPRYVMEPSVQDGEDGQVSPTGIKGSVEESVVSKPGTEKLSSVTSETKRVLDKVEPAGDTSALGPGPALGFLPGSRSKAKSVLKGVKSKAGKKDKKKKK